MQTYRKQQVRYVDDVLRADDDSAYLAFIIDWRPACTVAIREKADATSTIDVWQHPAGVQIERIRWVVRRLSLIQCKVAVTIQGQCASS